MFFFFYKFDNFQKPLTAPAVNGFEIVNGAAVNGKYIVNGAKQKKKTKITKFTVFRFFVNVFSR